MKGLKMTAEEIFEDLLRLAHIRGLSYCADSAPTNTRKIRCDFVLFLEKRYVFRAFIVVDEEGNVVSRHFNYLPSRFSRAFDEEQIEEVKCIVERWNGK